MQIIDVNEMEDCLFEMNELYRVDEYLLRAILAPARTDVGGGAAIRGNRG